MTDQPSVSRLPQPGRQAAHVLLDIVTAWDSSDKAGWASRANLALRRLDDVGAVTTTPSDNNTVVVDVSNLVGAATVLNYWLIAQLAAATNTDMEHVVFLLRDFVDSQAGAGSSSR